MQRTTLSSTIFGLLLFCCGGILIASEADELRERAKAMRKEASVLAERGNKEQAERLETESIKFLKAAEQLELRAKGREENGDRPSIDKEVQQLKGRLQDLVAKEQALREAKASEKELAEIREQIAGTQRELQNIHARDAGPSELSPQIRVQAEKLGAASRRIHHLRVAAENLKLAEAHDLAHQLMEQAGAMEREVEEGKKRLAVEMQKAHGGEHGPEVVRQLLSEVERLRAEVKELRQKVEMR